MLLQQHPHITIITYTWLRSEITDEDVFPPTYTVFRKDRSSRGRGVAVVIKDRIEAVLIEEVAEIECLCIKVNGWGHRFVLYALYRPPDATLDYVEKLQEHMAKHVNSKIIFAGDFNLPDADWERFRASAHNGQHVNTIFDIMLTHDVAQLVHEPTRVQGSCCSVLDIMFFPHNFIEHSVSVEHGRSDHRLVCIRVPLVPSSINKKSVIRSFEDYSRANDACIIEYLEARHEEFNDSDVCSLWNCFKNHLSFLQE